MNVLAILGHPRTDSFCGALLESYTTGACEAGAVVRTLYVAELRFEPNVLYEDILTQPDEPDIVRARNLIRWADHIVLVYPGWWGVMPALLKGFFDRVLTPGFAFRFYAEGNGWHKLLKGKTADIISTIDMPAWVFRLIYRQPGNHALRRSTLGFAGIRTTRTVNLGPVRTSTPLQRADWLRRVNALGRRLSDGAMSPLQVLRERALVWLAAVRPQFYPLPWIVYTIGALLAAGPAAFGAPLYWFGLAFLTLVQLATVFANEYYDYESDVLNGRYGPFNGGSRVLVDGHLTRKQVWRAVRVTLVASAVALTVLTMLSPSPVLPVVVVGSALALIAVGYTTPPLQLVYRTAGELDVALTHSLGVLLCGYVFHGGAWNDPAPYFVSVPIFLGILPAIILAGVPDRDVDRVVGKKTIAVRAGSTTSVALALTFTAATAVAAVMIGRHPAWSALYGSGNLLLLLYAAWLMVLFGRRLMRRDEAGSYDGLIAASLGYTSLVAVVPLLTLI